MGRIIKASALKERGMNPAYIRQLCHMKDSPFYQTVPGGDWRCDEEKLDKFFDKLAKEKTCV